MSITSFNPDDIDIEVGNPTYQFSDDYRTVTYSVNVTIITPTLGYIPKSITINLQIYDADGNPVSDPLLKEFPVGSTTTETLSGEITLTDALVRTIIGGGSITLALRGTIGVKYLGVEILSFDIPEQSIVVP